MTHKLTQTIVDRASASQSPGFMWDSDLKGFGVRIAPSGAKSYIVQYRPHGGRAAPTRRLTIGRVENLPLVQARRAAQEVLAKVALGGDPANDKKRLGEAERFDDFAKRYMDQHARPKKKPRSVEEDERNLRLHLLPAFGRTRVKDITAESVARFHAGRAHKPVNANRCLSLLSHMMTMAERWGVREPHSNPCRGVQRYRERSVERYLSTEEMKALGAAMRDLRAEGMNATALEIIVLLAVTGARRSEIVNLQWQDIDLARGCIRLRDSKTGKKVVPLALFALELLGTRSRSASPYVFPATSGEGPFQGLPKIWRTVRRRAGLDDVRLHDLRHGFASVAASQGAPLTHIGKALGHRELRTTARYAHLAHDPVQHVVERAATAISESLSVDRFDKVTESLPLVQ